ncbi:hypothetical protein [Noviherbaspirillum aerium]|uniref:hypothetical protein n=1 Tax=Noviherbaspirillum aerium TaxID=2588497 RepID=UPI00124CB516|nr:hypothetical protein [Noviherbaspirillum aerium]
MPKQTKLNAPEAILEIIKDWTGVLAEYGADSDIARAYVLDALAIAVRWRTLLEPAGIPGSGREAAAEYRRIMFERQAELVVKLLMYPSDGIEPEYHTLIVAQAKVVLRWLSEPRS